MGEREEQREEEIKQKVIAVTGNPELLEESWAELDSQGQIELLKRVPLPQELITRYWNALGDESAQFQFLCCKHQQLDPEFLKEHWEELDIDAQYAAMLSQDQLPDELVKSFWEGLKSHTGDDALLKAFAGNVRQERQPEGFDPGNKDSEEEPKPPSQEPIEEGS